LGQDASCIFCKIVSGQIPSEKLYEDARVICIRDIHPQAKTHLLVIPKAHVASLAEAFPENGSGQEGLLGHAMAAVTRIARERGLLPGGFRTVINTGVEGGQTVFHLHIHILGGEPLRGMMA
jgi:histidine triad (HIT) family protein